MTLELQWLWSGVLAYVAAGVLALIAGVMGRRPERTLLGFMTLGLVLHTVAITLRWGRLGHGPFITLFEILSSNVWSLMLVFTIAYWRVRAVRPAAAVIMPVLFLMMGWLAVTNPGEGHMPPTYRTIWLYVHIGFGKIFLGSVLIAVGLAGIVLLRGRDVAPRLTAGLPDDARLERLAFRFMVLGFLFETLMLISGAIWAQQAWGRYWNWDALETWSFLTWLTLAFYLHARTTWALQPHHAATAIMVVFALAFLTFFGVPFVSTAPHKGAV